MFPHLVLLDNVEGPGRRASHQVGDVEAGVDAPRRKVVRDEPGTGKLARPGAGQVEHQGAGLVVEGPQRIVVPTEAGQVVLVAKVAGVHGEVALPELAVGRLFAVDQRVALPAVAALSIAGG